MEKSGAKAYLVNTGWNGTGKRISIKDTRGIIDAILDGAILTSSRPRRSRTSTLRFPPSFPASTAASSTRATPTPTLPSGRRRRKDLASRFVKNFVKYEGNEAGKALVAAGPKA